jgi:hypothetical protein
MINNFQAIRDLLTFGDEDKFYFIQIFKRRKDNPDMKKDMVIIDNYFVYELEHFNGLEEKIIKQCNDNNARAYIRLNRRSAKQVALKTLGRIAKMIEDENYKHVKRAYLSCAGEYHKEEDKTWIIDLDRNGASDEAYDAYINSVVFTAQGLIQETEKDDTIRFIPTKNGMHLICRPFNKKKFKSIFPEIDLHLDNPTILFTP